MYDMKILLLGSQHGDELLGEKLYDYLMAHYSHLLEHIVFKIGNPKAHKAGVRYIESDLNRSYNRKALTYEEKRAEYLRKYITENDFDLVLDLHTTVCNQPPCFIIHTVRDEVKPFLRASHIEKVVCLSDPMIHSSLDSVSPNVLAIEVANSDITNEFLNSLCEDVKRYIEGKETHTTKKVYEVPSLLLKSEVPEEQLGSLVNFQATPQGYIPILVGTSVGSYSKTTHYLGFKATKETTITL
jgi:succinylglutamate desuccinylase